MKSISMIRWALILCILGLLLQLFATLFWSPATFVLFASVGVPLVLAGVVLFLWAVLRELRDKGAL